MAASALILFCKTTSAAARAFDSAVSAAARATASAEIFAVLFPICVSDVPTLVPLTLKLPLIVVSVLTVKPP